LGISSLVSKVVEVILLKLTYRATMRQYSLMAKRALEKHSQWKGMTMSLLRKMLQEIG
jgi:hypothetical protein